MCFIIETNISIFSKFKFHTVSFIVLIKFWSIIKDSKLQVHPLRYLIDNSAFPARHVEGKMPCSISNNSDLEKGLSEGKTGADIYWSFDKDYIE